MTELNEQQAPDLGDDKKAHRSRSGFWFGIIILLVVVSVAGVGFYFLQDLRATQENLGGEVKGEMSKQLSDYQAQLSAIQLQLANVSKEVASKDDRYAKTLADFSQSHQEKLNTSHDELTDAIQQIHRQLGKTRGDWLIADAEYLLSVASERLHLVGDTHTTLEALEAADQRLRESGDAGVIKIREKIAEEITVVKNITEIDIVGIYVAIQSQQDHADKLELLLPFAGKVPTTKNETDNASENNGLLNALGVKYSEQPVNEILTSEEAKFIHEQLRVKLEIAQLALVQHNETLFQSALADAKAWLNLNFTNNDASRNMTEELDKFSAIKIHGNFPDISLSLKMLKDISKLRIEADKSTQPTDTDIKKSAQTIKPTEAAKPVEVAKPAEEVKPAEAIKPNEEAKPTENITPREEATPAPTKTTPVIKVPAKQPKQ
ncbi:MAG: enzyme of heme biosynthesis [Methylococcales bacterium]|nr:enzyme of heme biosynthesis [Methylococcales bacterium]